MFSNDVYLDVFQRNFSWLNLQITFGIATAAKCTATVIHSTNTRSTNAERKLSSAALTAPTNLNGKKISKDISCVDTNFSSHEKNT